MPENNGVQYTNPPQSRNEAILEAGLKGVPYTAPPQSRIEDLLIQFIGKGGGEDAFNKMLENAKRSLVSNKGSLFFAFDASKEGLSGQTSTALVKNDYSVFKNNSHSCLIYSEDTTKRVVDTFFSFPEETFGENTYGFWIYIPTVADLNALNYIQIDAGSVNQHGQLSGSQKIGQYYSTYMNVGWNYCPFNQTHTLTVFSGLRVRLVDVNASTATEFHTKHVYFDSIMKNYAMKPCVLLAFDNSSDSNMYGVAYQEAKTRGIVGTFAYQGGDNPDGEGIHKTGVTREHLNEMLAEGWDVAQYDGFDMAQDIDDIKAYNEFLKGQGLEMTAYFPRLNAITEDIWSNLAEMGFKLARTANSRNIVTADNLDVIQSYGFNYTNTASITLGKINDAISENQSLCLLIHRVLETSDGTQSNCLLSEYRDLLDGLKALRDNGSIYIVTFREYYYDSVMKTIVDKFI